MYGKVRVLIAFAPQEQLTKVSFSIIGVAFMVKHGFIYVHDYTQKFKKIIIREMNLDDNFNKFCCFLHTTTCT